MYMKRGEVLVRALELSEGVGCSTGGLCKVGKMLIVVEF